MASSSGHLSSHSLSSVKDRTSTMGHGSSVTHGPGHHHHHSSTGSNSSGTQAKHKLSYGSGTRSAVMSTKRPGSSNGSKKNNMTSHKT